MPPNRDSTDTHHGALLLLSRSHCDPVDPRVLPGRLRRPQLAAVPLQPEVHVHGEGRDLAEVQEPPGRRGPAARGGAAGRLRHPGAAPRGPGPLPQPRSAGVPLLLHLHQHHHQPLVSQAGLRGPTPHGGGGHLLGPPLF